MRDVKDVMMEAGIASEVLTQQWRPMSRVGLPLKTWAMCFPDVGSLCAGERFFGDYAKKLARLGPVSRGKFGSAQSGGRGSGFAAGANTFEVGVGTSATRAGAVQAATAATGHAALDGGRAAAAQALASAVPAPVMQALQLLLQNLPQANKGGEKKGN
ncbi:hypothetical protein KFL_009550020 [Klebsormidium nitens]|uniref:Uncharacterized protein n=1 Tax=Klebsormidium nitens TaxID=105231 RepID=A0A1Y1INK1_KLENI|nr:hypothetical protein KFL_009550020 [Klebsormidium nitens]|eukprot:GAQ92243.1 hypothetical protein KFL_009550020 [Klebsormidium nitens]